MKASKNFLTLVGLTLALTISACEKPESKTDKMIQNTADNAKDIAHDAEKTADDAVETSKDLATDAIHNAKEAVGDAEDIAKENLDKADAELEEFPEE